MNRQSWLIVAGVCGTLVVLFILAYVFRDSFGYNTLGGPLAVVQGKPPQHGFLGVDFGGAAAAPLTIQRVFKGSGAAQAGLQTGDVILAAGTVENPDLAALERTTQATAPGDELVMTIGRGPDELLVRVRLISFAEMISLRQQQ